MNTHVGMLKELADLAARELVIEEAVEAIEAAFMACPLIFVMDRSSGIPGGVWGWVRGGEGVTPCIPPPTPTKTRLN